MTEIEQYTPRGEVATLHVDPTGGRLVAWAQAASAANALAKSLVQTSFVPRVKQGGQMVPISVGDATAAILMGDELGLTPLAALRAVYVVHGTPALYAKAMAALVLSHGHEMWTVEESPQRVTVAGRRRGTDHEERVTWTMDRARKAGYTKNAKYDTNPQEMLYARAAGDVARRIAPDVLAGVPYTVEEIELSQEPATTTVTREAGDKRTVQRRTTAKPETDEPPLDETPQGAAAAPVAPNQTPGETDAEDTDPMSESPRPADPDGITSAQLKKMAAGMRDLGITERAHALAYVARVIGREVGSRNELTKAEAHQVIEALEFDSQQATTPDDGQGWAGEGA